MPLVKSIWFTLILVAGGVRKSVAHGHPFQLRNTTRNPSQPPVRFDKARSDAASTIGYAVVAADDEGSPGPGTDFEPWPNEPQTLENLTEQYNLEGKCAGRVAGTSLFLVHAVKRNGKAEAMTDGQEFKLFMAPQLNIRPIPKNILGH